MKQRTISWATRLIGASVLIGLGGCAKIDDKAAGLLSSTASVHAIINRQLMDGDVRFFVDRTGTVALSGVAISCAGRFRYTATTAGVMDLNCNDGAQVALTVALVGETKGYAYGKTATAPATLTFGLTALEAKAYLTVPANKQWVLGSESLALEPR